MFVTAWNLTREELLFDQPPIGNTVSSLYFWSTDSRVVQVVGKVYTSANATTLSSAAKNFTQVAVTSDFGAEGNYKIIKYKDSRKQAFNYTGKWYEVSLELRKTDSALTQGANVAAAPWWLSGGASGCVAAYQPKSAASYAASKLDLSGSGNNASEGVAPSWDAVNGWQLNGTTQYLVSGVIPLPGTGSMFIQFTNFVTGQTYVGMYKDAAPVGTFLIQNNSNMTAYNGSLSSFANNTPQLTAGNYGFAGKTAYRNGVAEGVAIAAGSGTGTALFIGGLNYNAGTLVQPAQFNVTALAVYDNTLSGSAAAAVAAAMAAL